MTQNPPGTGAGWLQTRAVDSYDFARPRLRLLAGALAPAYLRIGGTDADHTVYRLDEGASIVLLVGVPAGTKLIPSV